MLGSVFDGVGLLPRRSQMVSTYAAPKGNRGQDGRPRGKVFGYCNGSSLFV
jgi:hypothetical protein